MNMQETFDFILNQPTLLKGVYYATHKQVVIQYTLWLGLTTKRWDGKDTEPTRCREYRHYLEAVGILRRP